MLAVYICTGIVSLEENNKSCLGLLKLDIEESSVQHLLVDFLA